jgi:hypothetical protein
LRPEEADVNTPKNSSEQEFNELRARLGLYPEVPVIVEAHPLAMNPMGGEIIFCCHDDANECSHTIMHEGETKELDSLQEDGSASPEMLVQIRHALAAAYN